MKYTHSCSLVGRCCNEEMVNKECTRLFPVLFAILVVQVGFGAELQPQTSAIFDNHIATIESRIEKSYQQPQFLTLNETEKAHKIRLGNILIEPAAGSGNLDIKGGMIQDWKGSMFIPSAKLGDVLAVAKDFPSQAQTMKPDISAVHVRAQQGDRYQVYMRLVKSKFVLTDVLNTEHDIRFVHTDPKRAYSLGRTTRVAEVVDPGKPGEHELPVGKDRGLLWRTAGFWLFEEKDGGVYVEWESVSLTRDIPLGMGKLFGSILKSLPAESVRVSMEATRKAVIARLAGVAAK